MWRLYAVNRLNIFHIRRETAMKSHRLLPKWEMAAAELPSADRGCTFNQV